MRKNWLWLLLLLSLAVNLGLLGTLAVRWIWPPKPSSEKVQVRADGLPEDDSELALVRQQLQSFRIENKALIDKSREARMNFVTTLSAPAFDPKQAKVHLREYLAARTDLEASLGENLIDVRSGMPDTLAMNFFGRRIQRREALRERLSDRIEQRNKLVQPDPEDSISTPGERLRDRWKTRIQNRRKAFRQRQQAD